MHNTNKLQGLLKKSFQAIYKFSCLPWIWAVGKEVNSSEPICIVEAVSKCCGRAPAACCCSVITMPVGGSSAIVLGALGGVGLCTTAVVDCGAAICSVPSQQQMEDPINDKTILMQKTETHEKVYKKL